MEKILRGFRIAISFSFLSLFIFYIAVPFISLLSGCVTPADKGNAKAVSLEEAKKVTAKFEEKTFTPPPRTINDITLVLAQEKPKDLEAFKRARALADSGPPVTTHELKLAKFYFERAQTAHEVGRANQEIEDYRLAAKYGEKSGFMCQTNALMGLSTAEVRGGNWSQAIQVGEKVLSQETKANRLANWNSVLAWMYAKIGDLDSARKALDRAEMSKNMTTGWTNFPKKWRDLMNSAIASGRAAYLDALGRLSEAEVQHIKAVKLWQPHKSASPWECGTAKVFPRLYNWKVSDLADNLRRQGRLVEAEFQARKAVRGALQSHGLYSAHTAMMVSRLNKVIFEQGRFKEAEILARANLDVYRKSRTARESALLAEAKSVLASAILAQRRWHEALVEYDAILEALNPDPAAYEGFVSQHPNLWLALVKGDRGAEALKLVEPAYNLTKKRFGETHYNTAETGGILAMALSVTGQRDRALRQFSRWVPILTKSSRFVESGGETKSARDFRLGLILDSYIRLLSEISGTELENRMGIDAASEAFRIADVIRGQRVKRALAASSARAATKSPELADLARREQDALAQIVALNGLLSDVLSVPGDQQNPDVIKDLRSRINLLRGARIALVKEIEERFPDYASLVNPKSANIDEARKNLRPREALIAFYIGDDRSFVWAIPYTGSVAFNSADLGAKEIAKMVSKLRVSLDPKVSILGEIPDFDLETAYKLYKILLRPIEAGWKNANNLLVVPHGSLGFLPFSVLPTKPVTLGPEAEPLFSNYRGVPWLTRTHTVTVLPSVASLSTLRGLQLEDPGRRPFVGFGDPIFNRKQLAQAHDGKGKVITQLASRGVQLNIRGIRVTKDGNVDNKQISSIQLGDLNRLPDTAEELRSMAQALGADPVQDVFLGKRASERQVKTMNLAGRRVIAFASHALVPGDLDGLDQPAIALSAPSITGDNEDGLLTMGEVLGLRLNAAWVVLSACNTAAGEGTGAEAVTGLGRAFFYAGTRALLVSNWPVETTSAKTLTSELFQRQAANPKLSRAEALNYTMLQLIDRLSYMDNKGRVVFSYAHPIFWAPFSLVGDGG